jgi:hypothetical protein
MLRVSRQLTFIVGYMYIIIFTKKEGWLIRNHVWKKCIGHKVQKIREAEDVDEGSELKLRVHWQFYTVYSQQ